MHPPAPEPRPRRGQRQEEREEEKNDDDDDEGRRTDAWSLHQPHSRSSWRPEFTGAQHCRAGGPPAFAVGYRRAHGHAPRFGEKRWPVSGRLPLHLHFDGRPLASNRASPCSPPLCSLSLPPLAALAWGEDGGGTGWVRCPFRLFFIFLDPLRKLHGASGPPFQIRHLLLFFSWAAQTLGSS